MLLIDTTHTSHTRMQSGVQQVMRALCREIPATDARPIVFDKFARQWRHADDFEWSVLRLDQAALRGFNGAKRWTVGQQLRGEWARRRRPFPSPFGPDTALLCGEVLMGDYTARLDQAIAACGGPTGAIFHDAIALKLSHLAPAGNVTKFPAYLWELRKFDGIAAVSASSKEDLIGYWEWQGWRSHPPVEVIPLGTEPVSRAPVEPLSVEVPLILCVSSIEGRKNHLTLLDAAEQLWASGHRFRLVLVGGIVRDSAGPVLERMQTLKAPSGFFEYRENAGQEVVDALFREAHFTVFPSLWEGFGLPVLESLKYGKPCVTSDRGGLAEVVRGGGCELVDTSSLESLRDGIGRLLSEPARHAALSEEARNRPIRTWRDYAQDVDSWMKTLPKRGSR